MDEAIRQKRIMTATLTNKLGVIESLDRSISQAGVDDTNLEGRKFRSSIIIAIIAHLLIIILGISSSLSLITAKKFLSHW